LTCPQALPGILSAHEKTGTTANLFPLLNMRGATTSMLDPSSGRTFRMFECQCGNKTWSSDGLSRHLHTGVHNPPMAHYTFRFRQGSRSSDVDVDLPDDDAAWDEAAAVCSDMIRDIITRLGDSPEWRLEVANKSGTVRHLFQLTAESFDP
jgi:hypothetical protein